MFGRKRILGAIVVVLLAVGGYAYADTRGSGTSYRTAVAATGTVQRTLSLTGTVTSAGRRDLAFGTSGTVQEVLVKQGAKVRKGQVLARLDDTSLEAAVISAKATLARARAQLVSDESSSSSSSSGGSSSSGSSASTGTKGANGSGTKGKSGGATGQAPGKSPGKSGGTTPTGTPGAGSGPVPTLDSTAVTAAGATLTKDTEKLTTALDNYVSFVQSTCTSAAVTASGQACDPSTAATTCADPTATPQTLADAKGCVAAAQSTIAGDADALSTAATGATTTYLAAVKKYAAGLVSTGRANAKTQAAALLAQAHQQAAALLAQAQKQASAAAKNATPSATGRASSSSSSAKQIASDEAAVVAARASLVSAREAARAATLRSPIKGKVVDVAVTKGDSASTSTTAVTVLGAGATTVSGTVTLAQIPDVKVGQSVGVVPAGWSRRLTGRVTSVGLVATTSTSGTTTYPVTVTIDDAPYIPLGTTAAMEVVTGAAKDAVTVPTSAVTTGSRTSTVNILEDGKATTTPVTVGIVGASRTTIESGLKAGQTVVLADLGAALPSGDNSSTGGNGLGGLGGGAVRFSGGQPGGAVRFTSR